MGKPDKTYDAIQRDAVLVKCSQCPRTYYATHSQSPELCAICRPWRYGTNRENGVESSEKSAKIGGARQC